MNKFVLVGTQRSGTTLIRTLLGSHPDVLCLGETFYLNKNKRKSRTTMGKALGREFSSWKSLGYQKYLEQSYAHKLKHILFRKTVMREYLQELYSVPGYKAVGFKLMANQLRQFPALLPYIRTQDVKVLHILRENSFAILLSRLVMEDRGYAHATSKDGGVTTVTVPTGNLLERLETIHNAGLQWAELFAGCPDYKLVRYECFTENQDSVGQEMLEFIGVDPGVELKTELVKSNNAPVSKVVENLDEVRVCLEGTQFSSCLM